MTEDEIQRKVTHHLNEVGRVVEIAGDIDRPITVKGTIETNQRELDQTKLFFRASLNKWKAKIVEDSERLISKKGWDKPGTIEVRFQQVEVVTFNDRTKVIFFVELFPTGTQVTVTHG